MARLVVLRFDDNEEAENFVQATVHGMLDVNGRVVGLFGQPTLFCECAGKRGRVKSYSRGQRWGWWVCASCKKPTRAWGTHLQAVLGAATNHLSIFLEKGKYGEMEPAKSFGADPAAAEDAKRRNEAMIIGIGNTGRGVNMYD